MPKLQHKVTLECKGIVKVKTKDDTKKKEKACGYKEDIMLEGLHSFFA